ncbi:hypothetical protein C8Q77DRAFT_1144521 [Trametes polyzona]|nr:hypothetical protein C8Q77DRAFT_1144521 [Trametes polyzona]
MRISGCRAASILAPAGSGLTAFAIILWSSGFMLAQRRTSGGQEASIWPVLARLLGRYSSRREDDRRSPFDLPAVSNWLSDESRPLVNVPEAVVAANNVEQFKWTRRTRSRK